MSALAPGLLVAAPPLGDPNFDHSVVLLAAHGPEGAFGWIVNGEELMSIQELLRHAEVHASTPSLRGTVRIGGPVAQEQIWLVYRAEERIPDVDGQIDVGGRIVASASRRVLEKVAQGALMPSLLALAGYAGWAPGQLEEEISAGAWLPVDVEADVVFEASRLEAWRRGYACVGASPIAFTTRTVGEA